MQNRTGALLMMGRLIVVSLDFVKSKLAKEACLAFIDAQNALDEANQQVRRADRVVREATQALTAADALQDSATYKLASSLAAEGGDRISPFKQFGVTSASKLVRRGHVQQAHALGRLAERVLSSNTASQASRAAAQAMAEAANGVLAASAQRAVAVVKRDQAIKARDTSLPGVWRRALSDLRLSIRFADAREGTNIYQVVFASLGQSKKVTLSR